MTHHDLKSNLLRRARQAATLILLLLMLAVRPLPADATFSFIVTADTRRYAGPAYAACTYFQGAAEAALRTGQDAFLISAGDIDPVDDTAQTVARLFGDDFPWVPVVGNHELPGDGEEAAHGANLAWLQAHALPFDNFRPGPSGCPRTTYAFDYGNAHFVILNVYCDQTGPDATNGDISAHLYTWLAEDLRLTDRPFVFVVAHEPAYPQPDADNGRVRHRGDSLDLHPAHRDRFWQLLRDEGVTAFICGHTHNYSAKEINGVWQIDVGHARGQGDMGARSTFVRITLSGWQATYRAYRMHRDDPCTYSPTDEGIIKARRFLPTFRGFPSPVRPFVLFILWAVNLGRPLRTKRKSRRHRRPRLPRRIPLPRLERG